MTKPQTSLAKGRARLVASMLKKLRRAKSQHGIIDALLALDAKTEAVKLDDLPKLLRMIRVSLRFDERVDIYGIERFFTNWPEPLGAYTKEAAGWYRTIGADRAAEYLERAAALFPGGRPPTDASAAREAAESVQARSLTAFEDPVEFLDAVREMVGHAAPGAKGPDWLTDQPNAANMLLVLRALYVSASMEGIWKFLNASEIGGLAHDAEAWCRAIGAKRAAAYLAETATHFPRRRIPRDDIRRIELVEALSEKGGVGRPDPLTRLDRKYARAVDEMVQALRDYLRAHPDDPVGALERLARPSRKPRPARTRGR